MTPDSISKNNMEDLLHDALQNDPDLIIPPGLSERVARKLIRRNLLRGLVLELVFKGALIIGSLAILAGISAWIYGMGLLGKMYAFVISNWYMIFSVLLIALFIILIDQIGMRYLSALKEENQKETAVKVR